MTAIQTGTALSKIAVEGHTINGVAVITKGATSDGRFYIDDVFLDKVVQIGNAEPKGISSNFQHNDEKLGTYLGKVTNFYRDGDVVRAKLTLSELAFKSPNGDLGSYILSAAKEIPEEFGLSIVFSRDLEEEKNFISAYEKDGKFISPDKNNPNNIIHARLYLLAGVDAVGTPAANPSGLFSVVDSDKNKIEEKPKMNEAEIRKLGSDEVISRFNKLNEKFGDNPKFVVAQFVKGNTVEQALAEHKEIELKELQEKLAAIQAENEKLKGKKVEPVEFKDNSKPAPTDMLSEAKILAKEKNITIAQAMSTLSKQARISKK